MNWARILRAAGVLTLVAAALPLTGCGSGDGGSLLDHAKDGHLTIGIKYDQPGLGLREANNSFTGFDVEVAKYVAGKLGVAPGNITFKEAPSQSRETLIENGQVDFIIATYSINDARKKKVDFAGPYYTAGASLLVRRDNTAVNGVESLGGTKVCSAKRSTPAQYISKNVPAAQLQEYDTYSQCLDPVKNGTFDALTTDDIILAGYAAQAPERLKVVGKPFTTEKYGIGLKKGDQAGRDKINEALEDMVREGAWQRAIDTTVGKSGYQPQPPPAIDRSDRHISGGNSAIAELLSQYWKPLLRAFWVTIQLTLFSAIAALLLGIVLAGMRVSPVPVARWVGASYVNIVRNTPLTLVILFCSLGLNNTLGLRLAKDGPNSLAENNFRFAVLGLSVYTAAFVCESLRAGINTVPLGQSEAGRSLGFGFTQNLRLIVLPQAFRTVVGPLGSVLIALTKNTTIASAIGVAEAAYLMSEMIENEAALLAIAAIFMLGFVVLTLPMGLLFGWLSKRFAVAR